MGGDVLRSEQGEPAWEQPVSAGRGAQDLTQEGILIHSFLKDTE